MRRPLVSIAVLVVALTACAGQSTVEVVVVQEVQTDPQGTVEDSSATEPAAPTPEPTVTGVSEPSLPGDTAASADEAAEPTDGAPTPTFVISTTEPTVVAIRQPVTTGSVVLTADDIGFDLYTGSIAGAGSYQWDLRIHPSGGWILYFGSLWIVGTAPPGLEGCSTEPDPVDHDPNLPNYHESALSGLAMATGQYACLYRPTDTWFPPGKIAQLFLREVTADSISFDYVTWDWDE